MSRIPAAGAVVQDREGRVVGTVAGDWLPLLYGSIASGQIETLRVCSGGVASESFGSGQLSTPRQSRGGAPMTPQRLLEFVCEMMMSNLERGFVEGLHDGSAGEREAARAAYGDWLEENGRPRGAALIRSGWVPGGQ